MQAVARDSEHKATAGPISLRDRLGSMEVGHEMDDLQARSSMHEQTATEFCAMDNAMKSDVHLKSTPCTVFDQNTVMQKSGQYVDSHLKEGPYDINSSKQTETMTRFACDVGYKSVTGASDSVQNLRVAE